ncbi:MAG TPA: DMT family transporter [Terriglobales bacterium]|nr:DMT family transporter [Terriglobales bacterium]
MSAGSDRGQARRRVLAADAALLGVTFVWGVTFPLVKAALADAQPLLFVAVRLSLAALLLLAIYRPRLRQLSGERWAAGAWLGLFLAGGYALQTAGLALTSPAAAAFLTSISVILVPLLLALFWRRGLPARAWVSTAVALAGLYLLLAAPGMSGRAAAADWRGNLLETMCALAFALHIVNLGEWSPRFGFRDLAVLQIGFAALFSWAMLPLGGALHWANSPRLWLALAVTAVLATAVAFTVQSWSQQFTPTSHTAVIFAAEPVFAWLAAAWGWHEPLLPVQAAGAVLIVGAMLLLEWRPVRG